MLLPFDILLLVLILVGLPLRAWFAMRALRAAPAAELPSLRRRLWTRAILSQWLLVAGVLALWVWQRRWWTALNVVARIGPMEIGMLIGIAFLAILLHRQRAELDRQPEVVSKLRARLMPVEGLMPDTRAEWPHFAALAVTAGVCEELLFRGFVTWALTHVLPSYEIAAFAQAALFGLAHAYQGPRGVWTTGMVGVFLTVVVHLTGTLWVAMLIHALMDLNAGDLAIRVKALDAREGRAARA
ncbi:MAG: CPBP family intramembrane metalloprotease [Candidatus Eisenbacteria bacterium]|uniref:CPBP family intramembrane metalloprotease n=1 Tax=Eiseniibacteriota bacterium TaxID=2212470 RepID=A0A933SC93_UNCEI|nr:CPBP family intramembrane metalloprotease [Candidatus Eisenbacteria bacterium]